MVECERRGLAWRWVHTAQHRETFASTLELFDLPLADHTVVDWNTEAKTLSRMATWTARMTWALAQSKRVLAGQVGPEHMVVTHGDTTSTVFGALFGRITRTPVMHVESGLRSHTLWEPFPEEINRLMTFRLSSHFACPGPDAVANVARYGGVMIDTVENTQVDVLRHGLARLDGASIEVPDSAYAVMSFHRVENLFKRRRLEALVAIVERVAQQFTVVIPQHPVTAKRLEQSGLTTRLAAHHNIELLPRLDYLDFLSLIDGSEFVMTDGGGNQEELRLLGKPTLLLREVTERADGLGHNAVISRLDQRVIADFVENYEQYRQPPFTDAVSPSSIVVDALASFGR